MGSPNKRMLKKTIILLLLLVLVPLVSSATTSEIPTLKQGLNQTLNVPCSFNGAVCPVTTTCNTTILNPNGVTLYNTVPMNKDGGIFSINLTSDDLLLVGQYENTISCCAGTTCRARELPFQVTPSGASPLTQGQSNILFLVLGVIVFIGIIFFVIAFKSGGVVWKVAGFAGGSIMILILVLYTMFIINEAISGTPNFVKGYETFLLVMRGIGYVAITGLVVIAFITLVRAWKIRRGIIDK